MPANLITLPHFSVSSAIQLAERGGRSWQRHVSEIGETGLQLGIGKPCVDRFVEHLNYLGRGVAGRADPIERGGLIARERLGHGRHVRQRVGAGSAGHRKRTQLAGLHIFDRRAQRGKQHLDLSRDQVGQRRRVAAIRHVYQIDAGHQLEQFAGEMAGAADAGRPHIDPARIGLCVDDELGDRLGRNGRVDRENRRRLTDAGDRQHVANKVEVEFFVEGGVDRVREIGDEQCVAVGG